MPKASLPPKFDATNYFSITLNDLVIYSIYYLYKQGSEITSEDIISACFVLFPKRFSLHKYPQWPDSAVVSRRWSDCKSKGYLLGSAVAGFKLTAKGIKHAEKVEKSLGKPRSAPAARKGVHNELTSRAGKYVRLIERSEAYVRYKKRLEINEFDFRSLLLCTMESPPPTLTRNLEQFKEYVDVYERGDLIKFLEFCENKFSHLLNTSKKQAKKEKARISKK